MGLREAVVLLGRDWRGAGGSAIAAATAGFFAPGDSRLVEGERFFLFR